MSARCVSLRYYSPQISHNIYKTSVEKDNTNSRDILSEVSFRGSLYEDASRNRRRISKAKLKLWISLLIWGLLNTPFMPHGDSIRNERCGVHGGYTKGSTHAFYFLVVLPSWRRTAMSTYTISEWRTRARLERADRAMWGCDKERGPAAKTDR